MSSIFHFLFSSKQKIDEESPLLHDPRADFVSTSRPYRSTHHGTLTGNPTDHANLIESRILNEDGNLIKNGKAGILTGDSNENGHNGITDNGKSTDGDLIKKENSKHRITDNGTSGHSFKSRFKDSIGDNEDSSLADESLEEISWIAYLRRFSVFLPYIWPPNNRQL